jgi:hypothetical protein
MFSNLNIIDANVFPGRPILYTEQTMNNCLVIKVRGSFPHKGNTLEFCNL